MPYSHTQTAPLYLLLVGLGLIFWVVAWFVPEAVVQWILLGSGALMLGLAVCFRQLTVSDEGTYLRVAFGPVAMFRRKVIYSQITSATPGRSTLLDGWGIHWSPSGGVVWNLWGFDCVDVHLKQGRKVRIGTDDPTGLATFLQQRVRQEIN